MSERAPGAVESLVRSHRLRWHEAQPWLAIVAAWYFFPGYWPLGAQILIMILFALSLDLILGYAGIVTLGHAAFFGVGAYTAGILAVQGWQEPLTGLVAAGALAGLLGLGTGFVILRTHGLALLMLTLAVVFMTHEVANKAGWLTGGADGLQGVKLDPVLGRWRFDLFGRTAYVYCAAVLLLAWVFARRLVHSPFGRSLTGIRENVVRMHAIGSPVRRRLVTVYAISASLAGVAGGLRTQTTQFVGLNSISFELSGEVLIMLVFGGAGRLYGAFIGATAYMLAQDVLAKTEPAHWQFGIGLLLVLVVLFARGGLLGIVDLARARLSSVRR